MLQAVQAEAERCETTQLFGPGCLPCSPYLAQITIHKFGSCSHAYLHDVRILFPGIKRELEPQVCDVARALLEFAASAAFPSPSPERPHHRLAVANREATFSASMR